MKIKLVAIAAMAALSFGSSAFAQSTSMDAAMAPFFMDKEMKQMKSTDEMKAAAASMSSEQKEMLTKECANVNSMHATFCQSFNEINK